MKHAPFPDETRHHRLLAVYLRGIAMGAADIVPGVSGGTIAFISGIYLRLLTAIGEVVPALLALLKTRNLAQFWFRVDGTFLVVLLAGIATSILSLARVMNYLLTHQAVLVWSFFFGLILAAIWHVGREIQRWRMLVIVMLVLGTALGWAVTVITPAQVAATPLNLLGAGAIAICAMILPGVSGSFMLLLMGLYLPVLQAIEAFDFATLSVFALGCLIGLISIARVIAYALHKFQDVTLALLTGFMVGSLNKVWPWKHTLVWGENSHGKPIALVEQNLLPFDYTAVTQQPHDLTLALIAGVIGFFLVISIEWLAARFQQKQRPVE